MFIMACETDRHLFHHLNAGGPVAPPFSPSLLLHSSYMCLVLDFLSIHLRRVLLTLSARSSRKATGRLWTVRLLRFLARLMLRTESARSCRVYPVFRRMASRSKRWRTRSSGFVSYSPYSSAGIRAILRRRREGVTGKEGLGSNSPV